MVESLDSFDVICLFGFDSVKVGQDLIPLGKTLVFFISDTVMSPFGLVVYYDGERCDIEAFEELCRAKPFEQFTYQIAPALSDLEREKALMWIRRCQEVQWHRFLLASEKKDFGLFVLQNIKEGLSCPMDVDSFPAMRDCFQGVPAFICGAGPSLSLDVDLLRQSAERGLIFSGGAALDYLVEKGVPIHIAAGVDPNPDEGRVKRGGGLDAPFFFQSRFSAACLRSVEGPLFRVPSNPGFVLESWLEDQEPFDGGWTVTTLCYALAQHFGCSPIILVGVDLSYLPAQSLYVEGVKEERADQPLVWEDDEQGTLCSKKDWIMAARWLESDLRGQVYSTSFSGLSLKGVIKKPLAQLLKEELVQTYDTAKLVQELKSRWTRGGSVERMRLLEESLERSSFHVEALLGFFQEHYPQDPRDRGLFVLHLLDLQEEVFMQKVLEPLWSLWEGTMSKDSPDSYHKELNKFVFFTRVLEEYRRYVCQMSSAK